MRKAVHHMLDFSAIFCYSTRFASFPIEAKTQTECMKIFVPSVRDIADSQYKSHSNRERSTFRLVSVRVEQSSRDVLKCTLSEFAKTQAENRQMWDVLSRVLEAERWLFSTSNFVQSSRHASGRQGFDSLVPQRWVMAHINFG